MSLFETSHVLSATAVIVSAASMAASWGAFLRDRGRLDVHVGIWKEADFYPTTPGPYHIRIRCVNSGRRPLLLESFGTYPRWQRLRILMNSFLPYRLNLLISGTKHFWPELEDKFRPRNGSPSAYAEGQGFDVSLPVLTLSVKHVNFWFKVQDIFVTDSIGRNHYVPRGIVRKLRRDLKSLSPNLISKA
jgi:hypothetical protein